MNSKRIKSKKNDNVTDSVIKSKKTSDRSKPFRGRIFSIASQRNDVKYAWPDDEIQMAEQISQEEQRYLFGTLRRPARNFGRTTTDNEIDMVAYMNNQQTWNASASRFLFFSAACLGLSALIMLYWSSYLSSVSEGLSFKQHIAKEGSISGMYRDKGTPSAPNRMFEAFMSAAALVILFSNFGFYLLPRWENEKSLNSRADRVGWCASECFRMFICFNYKRIESTSNWVVGEEGLFKLSWQALMPTTLLLLAMVPLPDDHNKIQTDCHTLLAIVTFIIYTVCELYQLIRGERMFRRSTGQIQKARFVCMIFALIGMFVYIGTSGLPKGKDNWGSFFSAVFETAGFGFLLVDMMLICLIPIKAEQSVFALGGTAYQKENCRIKSEWNLKHRKSDAFQVEEPSATEASTEAFVLDGESAVESIDSSESSSDQDTFRNSINLGDIENSGRVSFNLMGNGNGVAQRKSAAMHISELHRSALLFDAIEE